jgi:GDSL-like lipase/acylhydrolase family protein
MHAPPDSRRQLASAGPRFGLDERATGPRRLLPGRARKHAAFALVTALVSLLLLEGMSYLGANLLTRYTLFYVPTDTADYATYLAERDPELGWVMPAKAGRSELDARGSRVVPSFPDPDASPACGSAFGDSFTYGEGVAPAEAYPNLLAQELGCRVNNFGMGGYGTDQALLRYRRLADAAGRFVVLGHYAEDIVRNVNQLRDLNAGGRYGLKPRFVLEDGKLRLVPLPILDADAFARIADDARRLLPYEYFRPGGAAGIVPLRFPYTWRLLKVVWQYRVQAALHGVPSYEPFYDRGHPSGALDLTVAILAARTRPRGTARGHWCS